MKKVIYWFFAMVLFVSCTSDLDYNPLESNTKNSEDQLRSRSEIAELALMLQNETCPTVQSRANDLEIFPILSKSSRGDHDTLLYAVDFGNDNGFALFTANHTDIPVIAWSVTGSLGDDSDNPGLNIMLENSKAFVSSGKAAMNIGLPSLDSTIYLRADTITLHMQDGPRLETNWGQYWPTNIYCPNKVSGCVPTAMAQIAAYLKTPAAITIDFDSRITPNRLYPQWEQIIKHTQCNIGKMPSQELINNHYAECGASHEFHDQLALVVRQFGHNIDASYYDNGTTGASTTNPYISELFSEYIIQDETPCNSLYSSLIQLNRVALVSGNENGKVFGHAWVADGVAQIKSTVNFYIGNKKVSDKVIRLDNYVHHNWGWNGAYNVFALDGIFDYYFPGNFPSSETITTTDSGYCHNVRCMIVRKPFLAQ